MNNYSFSLCLLPDRARIHVIKSFDYPELIALSLISIKFKSLVQSFKLEFKDLSVKIEDDSLSIDVYYSDDLGLSTFKIYHDFIVIVPESPLVSLDEIPITIETISDCYGYDFETIFTWANPGLSFNGWFEHLRSIFTFSESSFDLCTSEEVFDTVAIRNLRPEWKSVLIESASTEYALKIFELFLACTREFNAGSINDIAQFPQKFAIQNYDKLKIFEPFSLDDALVSNTLELTLSNFTVFDYNRFIRSWIRGSNPRVKRIKMYPDGEIIGGKLLIGVQHQIMPANLGRMWNLDWSIRGGIDFRNKNGIPATLIIERGNFSCIRMYVWN